jgi:hypothetical protein
MTPSPTNILTDTGDQEAVDDAGPSTAQLEQEAKTPASEAYVKRHLRHHVNTCVVKRLRWWLVFTLGFMAAGQLAAVWIVRASLIAARAEAREMIRETVDQLLREHKILGEAPAPVGSVLVATKGGTP